MTQYLPYTGIGSRETPSNILFHMTEVATTLFNKGYTLRSGGADGADSAFEFGSHRSEIWIPWPRFNGRISTLLPTPEAFKMAEQFHPAWDRCSRGARALHARNCHQVLGADLKSPTKFIICWTKDGQASGGTGQALRIAAAYDIPVINMFWRDWQRELWTLTI